MEGCGPGGAGVSMTDYGTPTTAHISHICACRAILCNTSACITASENASDNASRWPAAPLACYIRRIGGRFPEGTRGDHRGRRPARRQLPLGAGELRQAELHAVRGRPGPRPVLVPVLPAEREGGQQVRRQAAPGGGR